MKGKSKRASINNNNNGKMKKESEQKELCGCAFILKCIKQIVVETSSNIQVNWITNRIHCTNNGTFAAKIRNYIGRVSGKMMRMKSWEREREEEKERRRAYTAHSQMIYYRWCQTQKTNTSDNDERWKLKIRVAFRRKKERKSECGNKKGEDENEMEWKKLNKMSMI